jgi:hypothetical protein
MKSMSNYPKININAYHLTTLVSKRKTLKVQPSFFIYRRINTNY